MLQRELAGLQQDVATPGDAAAAASSSHTFGLYPQLAAVPLQQLQPSSQGTTRFVPPSQQQHQHQEPFATFPQQQQQQHNLSTAKAAQQQSHTSAASFALQKQLSTIDFAQQQQTGKPPSFSSQAAPTAQGPGHSRSREEAPSSQQHADETADAQDAQTRWMSRAQPQAPTVAGLTQQIKQMKAEMIDYAKLLDNLQWKQQQPDRGKAV